MEGKTAICIGLIATYLLTSCGFKKDTSNNVKKIVQVSPQNYKGKVAFTFDYGLKNDKNIKIVLDVLDKYNAKSTFFVLGNFIEEHPEEILRLVENGHEIANHSYDHDKNNSIKECNHVAKLYKDLTGKEMAKYFRVPHLRPVNWKKFNNGGWERGYVSLITRDSMPDTLPDNKFMKHFKRYVRNGYSKRITLNWVPKTGGPGSIDGATILMHITGKKNHLLDKMITYVIEEGYKPVKFSELDKPNIRMPR